MNMNATKVVYLIGVRYSNEDTFIAMYQPCYSLEEAKKKIKGKGRKYNRSKYTILCYRLDPYWDVKAYSESE